MYFFTDPDGANNSVDDIALTSERPYPFARAEKITVRGLTTTSGKPPKVSPNEVLAARIAVAVR
jgi:hypothetical protein